MDESERRSVKRSRFDQAEPERKRHSRFDRRSRSPPSRREPDQPSARDRSPIQQHHLDEPKHSPVDPAAAAGTYNSCPSLVLAAHQEIRICCSHVVVRSFSRGRSSHQGTNGGAEEHQQHQQPPGQVTNSSKACRKQWRDVHRRWRLHQGHRNQRPT